MKKSLLLTCLIICSFSVFSQKETQFEKRKFIGLEMATGTLVDHYTMWERATFNVGLNFEQQFSKHLGYVAGIGINRHVDVDHNIFSTLAENNLGVKYYSKAINLLVGVHTQTVLSVDSKEYYWSTGILLGPYIQLSKELKFAQNWLLEPFIKAKFESQSEPTMMLGLKCKYLLK